MALTYMYTQPEKRMAVNVCKKFYAKQKKLRKTKDPDRAQGREYGSMQQEVLFVAF